MVANYGVNINVNKTNPTAGLTSKIESPLIQVDYIEKPYIQNSSWVNLLFIQADYKGRTFY